ncbi:glycosyl hydrolase family 16 [Flavobacteriaceae bacterium TP-CH-4]|uniref:Glycosyl hydrolase family 16 n=1 Tax=Pelagihabitans pacificus TaxID=2696054 RepID=A0A967ASF4_9FLAO|nr:glycosyl hydrolase family 16 [Pelagihabitans pacificus]NHF59526.1 glycosyl hydrolase family 16 [Pelagihabitans pacificus]
MKNFKYSNVRFVLLLAFGITVFFSCEREFSEDVEFATFNNSGEVFTDAPVGLGSDFYFPFLNAKATAFSVDEQVGFESDASIRIDVPNADDPEGSFAGAIFRIDGSGRDLTQFDALTFYAKASQGVIIGEIGFGQDFVENKFQVTRTNVALSTNWVKYVIPIPDPSKLIEERGMLWFSAGTNLTFGFGYTFWLDEVKFEKLGTIAQPRPAIFNGQDVTEQAFTGSNLILGGLTQTFNLESGINQTVIAAPSYFKFTSSDVDVAQVNELGEVAVIGEGTATITAQLANVGAQGSLEVTSIGGLQAAPTPTRPAANVSSIFSDVYPNVTESNFSPGFGGSTTETSITTTNGDAVLTYANNNFTGIIFENTVDASARTFLHVDVYAQAAGTEVEIQIRDVGANQELETDVNTGFPIGDDVDLRFTLNNLTVGQWTSFDIPLDGDLATQRNNLGALILIGGPNFIFDNIYFYTE